MKTKQTKPFGTCAHCETEFQTTETFNAHLPWFTMANLTEDSELHPMVSIWSGCCETKESIVCNSCSPADAKFIVRACNNTQRLADAGKRMIDSPNSFDARQGFIEALAEWEKAQ